MRLLQGISCWLSSALLCCSGLLGVSSFAEETITEYRKKPRTRANTSIAGNAVWNWEGR